MAWKTCVKELLWFIRGDTDNKILQDQKVGIWNGNSTREFLDSRGLTHRRVGDLGPVYGFQWRHFGAKYVDCDSDYSGQGVDQLEMCVDMLKNDKYSRRIIMSAWNPPDLDKSALPACHVLIQWYVDSNDKLWLQFYQRSADMFLGVPFNMFSYAIFLHMMSAKTGIAPGGVVHSIGDAHIYADHKDAVMEQLKNPILDQPKIKINFKDNWADYDITDFELIDYKSAGKISAPMSA
jgi:thymidylate synthase